MLQGIYYVLNIIHIFLSIINIVGKWIWLAFIYYPITLTIILIFRLPQLDGTKFPLFEFMVTVIGTHKMKFIVL